MNGPLFRLDQLPPKMRAEYERLYGKPDQIVMANGSTFTASGPPRKNGQRLATAAVDAAIALITPPKKQRLIGPNGEKYRSKLEADFHQKRLAELPPGHRLVYEGMRLKIIEGAEEYRPSWYKCDFVEIGTHLMIGWECKGHWREAAALRIKAAAHQYPHLKFRATGKRRKKEGGGWWERNFSP